MKVVIKGKDRQFKRFDTKKEAEEYKKKVEDKLKDKVEGLKVGLVCEKAGSPEGEDEEGTGMWCPFCRKYRNFIEEEGWPYQRCEYCGISVMNFYVKKYNHLW